MSTSDFQKKSKEKTTFYALSCINLLAGMVTLFTILTIPTDLKNAFLWGYSINRLVLIGITIVLLCVQVFLVINSRKVLRVIEKINNSSSTTCWRGGIGFITAIVIWVTIWLPENRLGTLAASYIRIRPLLLWVELLIFQFFIYNKLILNGIKLKEIHSKDKSKASISQLALIFIFFGVGLFGFLRLLTQETAGNQLIFPPGAPLSSVQLLLGWLLFIGVFLLGQKTNNESSSKRWWIISVFILIWIITFFVWNSAQ